MLINLSNHVSTNWPQEQLKAAKQYGLLIDIPFPAIDPKGDMIYIVKLAQKYLQIIVGMKEEYLSGKQTKSPTSGDFGGFCVHIMGELTFCFALVALLQKFGIKCIASTTKRVAIEENGVKTSAFRFIKFREYGKLQ